jgi:Tfp pilus assembly protein PilN
MTTIQRGLSMSLLCLFLAVLPGTLSAQSPPPENAQEIITLLKEQNSKLSGHLRRIQREIAALRADLDKPKMKDVFAGIGYIFGLLGVAAFVAARRKE